MQDKRKLYQPALYDRQIRALYWLKVATGLPMTHHARLAIDEYLARFEEPDTVDASEHFVERADDSPRSSAQDMRVDKGGADRAGCALHNEPGVPGSARSPG